MSIFSFTMRENPLAEKPIVRYEGKNSSYPQMLRKAEDLYWELHWIQSLLFCYIS